VVFGLRIWVVMRAVFCRRFHLIVTALFCPEMSFTAYAQLRLPQVAGSQGQVQTEPLSNQKRITLAEAQDTLSATGLVFVGRPTTRASSQSRP
jgi:hypothetical protein